MSVTRDADLHLIGGLFLIFTRVWPFNISVQVDHEGESSEQVHDFKFLGSYKSADGDCTKEIGRRIAMARQKAVVLDSILKDRNIKTAMKVKVMKSMV